MRFSGNCILFFTVLFICPLLILPLNSAGIASISLEKDTASLTVNNDIKLTKNEISNALHWSNTPVTRDPWQLEYLETSPVSASGGSVDFLYSSNDLSVKPGVRYRAGRTDPSLVDLYVESDLYLLPMVNETISQYVYDKTVLGDYQIDVYSVSSISPSDFREQLHWSYINGTTGAVLLGDLPEVIFEMNDSFGGYESFPCDLYFMDVDGEWADNDSNGKMDYHGGELEADIWISRIKPSMIPTELESTLTVDYFGRVHSYFMGDLRVNHTALLYIDDDWAPWGDLYAWNISALYPEPVLVNNIADTNGGDYIDNRVTAGYEFIQVHVHSSPTVHYFAQGGNVHASQVRVAQPQSLFMNLFCCSGSDYDAVANFGATYMFFGRGLATIGSTKTGSMLNFGDFYTPLANHRSMGEAFLDWSKTTMERSREWHYGMSLQGDGLLSPKYDSIMYPPEFTDRNNGTLRVNGSTPENILIDIDITTQKGSVLDTAEYRINNGPWIGLFSEDCFDFTNDWNISKNSLSEGNNTITVRAETIFNVGTNYNLTIMKDTLAPANIVMKVEDGTGYVNERDVILGVNAWDVSGLDMMSTSTDGINWAPWVKYAPTMPFRLPDSEGIHDIHLRISDTFFNIEYTRIQVELDRVLPKGCNISINNGNPFTSSRNVTLTISTLENMSNLTLMSVSMLDYWLPDWIPLKEEITYELEGEEGIFQIFMKVRDRANNTSPVLSSTITYDPTPPMPVKIVANNGVLLTNDTTVHLELKAHDNTSGIDKMRFGFDGLEWNPWVNYSKDTELILPEVDGEINIYFQVLDGAGNVYDRNDVYTTLILDTTPPISDVIPSNPPDGSNGWYVTIPNIEIEHNGIAAYYRLDDNNFIFYEGPITLKEGESVLNYYSVDMAGNSEKINKKTFKVDTIPPVYGVNEICRTEKNLQGWYHDEVVLEFSSEITPMSRESIRLETPALVDLTGSRFTIDVDGINFIQYWALDEAGNIGRKTNITIMIDREPPRLSAKHRVEGKKLILDLSASDNVGELVFDIDPGDGSGKTETGEFHWERQYKEGNYRLIIVCRDESGLTSKKYVNFTIERVMLDNFYGESGVTIAGYLAMGGFIFFIFIIFILIKRKRKVPAKVGLFDNDTGQAVTCQEDTPPKKRIPSHKRKVEMGPMRAEKNKIRKEEKSDEWEEWIGPDTKVDDDPADVGLTDVPEKAETLPDKEADKVSDWLEEDFWEWNDGEPEETEETDETVETVETVETGEEIGWLEDGENWDDNDEFEIWGSQHFSNDNNT